jgi:hypothetical protein
MQDGGYGLPRKPIRGSAENPVKRKFNFGEYPFYEVE